MVNGDNATCPIISEHHLSLRPLPTVATYPTAGGWRGGSQVRLPRKEGARSRHQRLFEKNVGKTKRFGLRTLSVKGSGVVFMHGEDISTSHVHHKRWQPLIKCAISYLQFVLFSLFYVFMGLLYFLSFCGRQGVSLAPMYPQLWWGNQTYVVLLELNVG